jgi:hypothetical protein
LDEHSDDDADDEPEEGDEDDDEKISSSPSLEGPLSSVASNETLPFQQSRVVSFRCSVWK